MFILKCSLASLLLSISYGASVVKNADECKLRLMKVDQCVSKILLFTDPNLVLFDSKITFAKEYCEPFPAWLKCVNEYKPCLKSFQRTLFSMIVSNFKKAHAKFCKTPELTQEAYKHARCIKPNNRETFLRISDKLVGLADHVSEMSDINQVIPALCCGARVLIHRTEVQVNDICKSISAPDTGTFLMGVISTLLGDVLDLVCSKFPTVQTCYSLEGDLTRSLNQMQLKQGVSSRQVMRSFLGVLQRLDSVTADGGQ